MERLGINLKEIGVFDSSLNSSDFCDLSAVATQRFDEVFIDAPWCWNIYLHDWAIIGVNVGKYSSTMEHLGVVDTKMQ